MDKGRWEGLSACGLVDWAGGQRRPSLRAVSVKCTFINYCDLCSGTCNQLAALRVVSRSTTIVNSERSRATEPLDAQRTGVVELVLTTTTPVVLKKTGDVSWCREIKW